MGEHPETHGGTPKLMLEGTYSPAGYLEESVTLERRDYTTTIKEGRIEVVFHHPEPLPDTACQAAVQREVTHVFQSQMVFTAKPWEMTGLTLRRHYPDGRADIWVSASSVFAVASVGGINVVISDADGNVIKDTRAERLADEQAFRDQCMQYAEDPLLKDLMVSFGRAVADPADRMTHLYEIRDALSRWFRSEKEAKNALGLTNKEWSDLGRIANSEPIKESRHRGSHSALRPATEDEQDRVFAVARRMIRAYLDHLDRSSAAE